MSTRLVLATTIFVALTAPAFADGVDGVLITQANAVAGSVTPGDAPGFPVTLTQPGLYKFADNLTVPSGRTGILVNSDDVTIDLNGYRLRAAFFADNTIGIRSDHFNVTIRNGTIADFDTGIAARGINGIVEDSASSTTRSPSMP